MSLHLSVLADSDQLSQAAADRCVRCAEQAIASRGRFNVALSGGSTPAGLYQTLAAAPFRERTDWTRWHVFWGDERVVPSSDPRSNFLLARENLLLRVPIPAEQIHRVPTELEDPLRIADAYESEIRSFFEVPPGEVPMFDFMLQGLGTDGHTASLFPGAPALQETERLVIASPPGLLPPPVPRVTFTLPLINAAQDVVFLVASSEKASVLARVLAGDATLPAARVHPSNGELWWFADRAAASELGADLASVGPPRG